MKKVAILMIRHGETEANRDNILQGQCDYPLTEKGLEQAKSVGKVLETKRFSKVYSSDLPVYIKN